MRRAALDDVPGLAELLNEPTIRPGFPGEGELDPTHLLADGRNVCFFDERGGGFFAWRGPGVFEAHWFFKVRGREALGMAARMLLALFTHFGARIVWGLTPLENRAARWFNRKLGGKVMGRLEVPDSGMCELFSLEKWNG